MGELAVTAVGVDKPGIVAAVAEVLRDRGGNIADSAMTILGGHFAVVLLVETDDSADELEDALSAATDDLGLRVTVQATDPGVARSSEATHLLSVYGSDQPGLLARVTRALAMLDVNITDLETRLLAEQDRPVYAMVVELVAPDGRGDDLADAIAAACDDLGIDHTLRAIDVETY
jgi:glycine cleavage system transcriptional repressor